jgi:hypothetical protein
VGYHVALDLSPEQVKRLKLTATTRDQSVKDFVTELVVKSIDGVEKKSKREEKA